MSEKFVFFVFVYILSVSNVFFFQDFCEADASSTYKGQLELAITGYEATYAKQEMQQSS